MLALWSRATRNPGTCRCIPCLSDAPAFAGRGSASPLKAEWALGTPTSTFLYTAIFAAGLAVDARAKQTRNYQWDAAFDHLREELGQTTRERAAAQEECPSVSLVHRAIEDVFPEGTDWDKIFQVAGTELVDNEVLQKRQVQVDVDDITESFWDLLPFDSRFPGEEMLEWPVNTGPHMIRRNLPPQSLWATDNARLTAIRNRHSWKKLSLQRYSVGMLIHSLMRRANSLAQLSDADLDALSPHLKTVSLHPMSRTLRKQMYSEIEKLQSLSIATPPEDRQSELFENQPAIPSYHQDSDGDFYEICRQMNIAIKQTLDVKRKQKMTDYDVALATAKLCHNLLVSSAPPDVQTFDLLITGFGQWNCSKMVDDAIASFYACKIRPNEISCAVILEHYIKTNRPDAFSRFVGRMRGTNDALMLATSGVNINEASQGRLVRKGETKVLQKVHPTPLVFNTLMRGALHFAGFERALEIYYEMKEDGWGLDMLGLTHFLRDCIIREDWTGGLYVWGEINSIKSQVKRTHMAKAYAEMLGLCTLTGNTAAYNQILIEVAKRGFDRKRIFDSALGITRKSKNKRRQSSLTPPMTADNLLIAVSGYMNDSKAPKNDDYIFNEAEPFTQTEPESQDPLVKSEDKDHLWSVWLEHELGRKPFKSDEK